MVCIPYTDVYAERHAIGQKSAGLRCLPTSIVVLALHAFSILQLFAIFYSHQCQSLFRLFSSDVLQYIDGTVSVKLDYGLDQGMNTDTWQNCPQKQRPLPSINHACSIWFGANAQVILELGNRTASRDTKLEVDTKVRQPKLSKRVTARTFHMEKETGKP